MADDDRIRCHLIDVEGVTVSARGRGPITDKDREALRALVRAVKAKTEQEHPHTAVIQELLTAVRLAAHCIPDGPVHAGALGERDGAEVRTRLKRAALAARFALDPEHARRFAAEQAARKAKEAGDAT